MSKSISQQRFDQQYITASEIINTLGVTRSSVHIARKTGRLCDPINVHDQIFIWDRAKIQPYLDAWRVVLTTRRGANAA